MQDNDVLKQDFTHINGRPVEYLLHYPIHHMQLHELQHLQLHARKCQSALHDLAKLVVVQRRAAEQKQYSDRKDYEILKNEKHALELKKNSSLLGLVWRGLWWFFSFSVSLIRDTIVTILSVFKSKQKVQMGQVFNERPPHLEPVSKDRIATHPSLHPVDLNAKQTRRSKMAP